MMGPQSGPTQEKVFFPQAVNDLMGLMEFLKDREKVESYLEKLKAYRDEVNIALGKVGQADDINKLHRAALDKNELAEKELKKAIEEANEILEQARVQAEKELASVNIQRNKHDKIIAEQNETIAKRIEALALAENDIAARKKQCMEKEGEIRVLQKELDQWKEEMVRKKAILQQL